MNEQQRRAVSIFHWFRPIIIFYYLTLVFLCPRDECVHCVWCVSQILAGESFACLRRGTLSVTASYYERAQK